MRKHMFPVLAAALLFAGCGRVDDSSVLATVGSRGITVGDYRKAFKGMKADERPALKTPEDRRAFLDDLVDRELMEQVAVKKYPDLSENQVRRLTRFKESELRNRVEEMLVREQIHITKQMKDQLYADISRELHVMGLLIVDPKEAEYVMERLRAGDDFGVLAKDHSAAWVGEDIEPGDMGWVKAGQLPWPVHRAVWDSKFGELVGPFTLPMGTYIHRALEERRVEPPDTREALDEKLENVILQELYLNRQKAVQDSLKTAQATSYTNEGKALIMSKFYWEIPPEFASDPMARLNAPRSAPTYTPEEEAVVVVDFTNLPDWTLRDFTTRLDWYPAGLWPTGFSEEEVDELLDMMVRDYLKIEAAAKLGVDKDPEFLRRVANKEKEMRTTFFYYSDVLGPATPTREEVTRFFEEHRERYRAPVSYKVASFASANRGLIERLAADWKGGASFTDLRARYEKEDPALKAVGESAWLYEGEDFTRDNLVMSLEAGTVGELRVAAEETTVYQLVVKRPSRLLALEEIHDQVAEHARDAVADKRLESILDQERKQIGVKVFDKVLSRMKVDDLVALAATEPASK